jgi:SAM-dependent methyltransferase
MRSGVASLASSQAWMRGSAGLSSVIVYNQLVKAAIAQRLIEFNREFYQKLAQPFSASRRRLQPGVQRVLEKIPAEAGILDLGCGNGGVARELARRGHTGRYVGVDFSEELLQVARSQAEGLDAMFLQSDLNSPEWQKQLLISNFDFILAFAVLHHIPSGELRLQFLRQVRGLLGPPKAGGSETRPYSATFIHSSWQFLNSSKLRSRIQPWQKAGLTPADVDEGDYLLDWRSGGSGLRYVHQFSKEELEGLAAKSGFEIKETFLSDGKSGDLSLYSIWEGEKRTG